jgi:hypothetical protein
MAMLFHEFHGVMTKYMKFVLWQLMNEYLQLYLVKLPCNKELMW